MSSPNVVAMILASAFHFFVFFLQYDEDCHCESKCLFLNINKDAWLNVFKVLFFSMNDWIALNMDQWHSALVLSAIGVGYARDWYGERIKIWNMNMKERGKCTSWSKSTLVKLREPITGKMTYFAQYLVKEGKYADELPRIICTFPNCCY